MKNTLLFSFFLLLISASSFSQGRMKSLDIVPDSAWFEFWEGDWNIHWYGKDSVEEKGENHISKILNEKVLFEEFSITKGVNAGFVGKSWTVFNKNTSSWSQTWVDNSGAYMEFVGSKEGQSRIFKREVVRKDGSTLIQRMVFKDVTFFNFTWNWESSVDGGKTWANNWQLFYTRKQ